MQEILKIPNYLTNEECDRLVSILLDDSIPYDPVTNPVDIAWANRVKRPMWPEDMFLKLTRERIAHVQMHFGVKFHPLPFNQVLNIWREGMHMLPHSDEVGDRYPERNYASLIYLNDDYEGGELYIPSLNFELKPQKGMMVAFAGGTLLHGVKPVISGTRYTNSCWLKISGS